LDRGISRGAWRMLAALAALAALAGCGEERPADTGAASEPAAEVRLLAAHLRANDLNAFVHAAVPPELQAPLQQAWRENRSRWPLDELPFGERVPGMLQTLAAPKAEQTLRRSFDRQFANANRDIRSAATGLGLFGVKYVEGDRNLSEEERAHYMQAIPALSDWAKTAKLGDPQRARRSIAQLTAAARRSGLQTPEDFGRYGMEDSLRRLGPVFGTLKTAMQQYGLDLDRSLKELTATVESQDGDRARVRMRYPLGERTIDTVVALERVGERWYLRDYLRHARAAAAATGEATMREAGAGAATNPAEPGMPASPPSPLQTPPRSPLGFPSNAPPPGLSPPPAPTPAPAPGEPQPRARTSS
jgi:hypothetical protein